MKRRRIDVNLTELDQLLDQAREAPLSEPDCNKIKTALHTLAQFLAPRTTENRHPHLEESYLPYRCDLDGARLRICS